MRLEHGVALPVAIVVVVLGVLIIQWIAGAAYFRYQCSLGQGYQVFGRPSENSLAISSRESDAPSMSGCPEFCVRDLLDPKNRMAFLEILVEQPDPARLSEKSGWYRYQLLKTTDSRCLLFSKSIVAKKEFLEIARQLYGPSFPAKDYCIGATQTDNIESQSELVSRVSKTADSLFGVRTYISEFRDRKTGNLYATNKFTIYSGSYLYLFLTAIYVDSRVREHCPRPYESPPNFQDTFQPRSDLPPIFQNSEATK